MDDVASPCGLSGWVDMAGWHPVVSERSSAASAAALEAWRLRIMIHSIVPPLPRHGYAPSTISAVRVDRMVRMHRRIERWRSGVSWLPLPAGLGLHRLEYRKELGILIEIHRA